MAKLSWANPGESNSRWLRRHATISVQNGTEMSSAVQEILI